MIQLFHPLLTLIATASDSLLARYVLYLKNENRILRGRIPGEIHTKPHERTQLLKYGQPLGTAINELITIVTPGTFHRWVREEKRGRKKKPIGRPGKSAVLRELILKIARETGFGYTRILGELRKLGISRICRQTVKNIVKEAGIEPSPKRSTGTWDQFLKTHAETLWACDFFTKRAMTPRGLVDLYVLVFMHLETREVFVTPSTRSPDSAWVTKQAKVFVNHVADRDEKPTCLIHDRDTKFSAEFKQFLKSNDIKPKMLPIRSPNLNARVERFVQTIKYEALNHFIAFGKVHLDYLVSEFVDYYNKHRAHSSREYLPPCCAEPPPEFETIRRDEIHCEEHLGGLIKSYERIAA
ncbi:integrase core domain-containing protein [Gimesia maris]|uniref:integrase core domain-containing protein n=1 Tax=Gimesia maris TaxID=122 RepID=UPI00242041A1|nr:integrase core domain-containing protein [Gimesia maris]|tara:strand:+ start:2740 stop:3801 length:1062 start_codon:yes stop_codon:yes gene_type:complete